MPARAHHFVSRSVYSFGWTVKKGDTGKDRTREVHFQFNAARLFTIALLFIFVLSISAQSRRVPPPTPTPPPMDDDTERVETEEIKLNVVALNDGGEFVGD